MNRHEILSKIKKLNQCDLLVIGGGATGCGIALDAASRGMSVVLVEQNDFAEGTSGRSSKLVHGGVRYLEMAVKQFDRDQYQLVKEGLYERYLFLRNAPHLTQTLPLISPLYRWTQLPYVWIGLKLYDLLAGVHGLGPSGYSPLGRTLEEFPLLQRNKLKGGIRYYDGQFNDSRMTLALALSAAEHGALIANHLQVSGLNKENGKLQGVKLVDRLTRDSFALQARAVVNACGPFSDNLRLLDSPTCRPLVAISSGVHIVLDRTYQAPTAGLLLNETEDNRVLFVLPWQGRCLVGTTEQPANLSEHPPVLETEIAYLLRHLQPVLDPPPVRGNVSAAWSGLRPLVHDPQASDTSRLLRDFVIEESPSGLFSIVGGKWTSYRRMAEKLVDRVATARRMSVGPCLTHNLSVHGAENWQPLGWQQLAQQYQLDETTARYLHDNYGSRAPQVADLAGTEPFEKLAAGHPFLAAEVRYAVRYELAERAIDLLARRLPLALLDTALAKQVGDRVIELMAQEKDWSDKRQTAEKQLLEERLQVAL